MSWLGKRRGMLHILHTYCIFIDRPRDLKRQPHVHPHAYFKAITTPKPFLPTKAVFSFYFFATKTMQDQTCNQNNVFWWAGAPDNTWNYRLGLEWVPRGWSIPRLFPWPLTWSFWLTLRVKEIWCSATSPFWHSPLFLLIAFRRTTAAV